MQGEAPFLQQDNVCVDFFFVCTFLSTKSCGKNGRQRGMHIQPLTCSDLFKPSIYISNHSLFKFHAQEQEFVLKIYLTVPTPHTHEAFLSLVTMMMHQQSNAKVLMKLTSVGVKLECVFTN